MTPPLDCITAEDVFVNTFACPFMRPRKIIVKLMKCTTLEKLCYVPVVPSEADLHAVQHSSMHIFKCTFSMWFFTWENRLSADEKHVLIYRYPRDVLDCRVCCCPRECPWARHSSCGGMLQHQISFDLIHWIWEIHFIRKCKRRLNKLSTPNLEHGTTLSLTGGCWYYRGHLSVNVTAFCDILLISSKHFEP